MGIESPLSNCIVPKALRAKALWLIEFKMNGQRRIDARSFVRFPRRKRSEVEAFIARIEKLPDLAARPPLPKGVEATTERNPS